MSGDISDVELKITLGDDIDAACRHLGLDAVDPEPYQLWFCEVVRLDEGRARPTLSASNLILRLRSRADADDDTTVKLRGPARLQLPAEWDRRLGETEAKYEGDWTVADRLESASLTHRLPAGSIVRMIADWPPLPGALLAPAQVRFAAAVTGRSRHLLRAAQPLGPVWARKWEGVPGLSVSKEPAGAGATKEVYAERWQIGTLDFLELSIQVKERSARRWQQRFTASVSQVIEHDTSAPATKTKLILDHLLGRTAS